VRRRCDRLTQPCQQQQQQQQQQQGLAPVAAPAADGVEGQAASSTATATTMAGDAGLRACAYKLDRLGPELLRLRVALPGVASSSEVSLALRASAGDPQQQQLVVRVPGRYADLQLDLGDLMQQQQQQQQLVVCGVRPAFSRRRQRLTVQLHLSADASSPAGLERACEAWYIASDASSGSESDGAGRGSHQCTQRRSMRAVASEWDLASVFGSYSSEVAHTLMQRAHESAAAGSQAFEEDDGAGPAGSSSSSSKKAGGKRKAGSGSKKQKKK
jgi:hypothetical protein